MTKAERTKQFPDCWTNYTSIKEIGALLYMYAKKVEKCRPTTKRNNLIHTVPYGRITK